MVTIDHLIAHVKAEVAPRCDDSEVVTLIVRCAIAKLGLVVSNHGEVYDPAPKPVFEYPADNGVRWTGSGRRRGRGRR